MALPPDQLLKLTLDPCELFAARGWAPKAKAETGLKKLSAIDAAAKVLAEAGEPWIARP